MGITLSSDTMKIRLLLGIFATIAGSSADYTESHCKDQKQAIVHLFEWSWDSIANECINVLGPKGYCGVQVSPPMEHIQGGEWWTRYQPVSYKLESRSGNRDSFINMVNQCNSVGVMIIIDAVVNHMTGHEKSGQGTGGSGFNGGSQDYPGVPFSSLDFHQPYCEINNYGNADEVRNCYLVGLNDLDGGKDYVRQKIADYFNDLINIGVKGFRVDASKHMWPGDLEGIQGKVQDLPEGGRPLFFHEVIDMGGEAIKVQEYFGVGKVTEFRYGIKLAECIRGGDFNCLGGIYDSNWGMADGMHAVTFVDNHDNQRGHGGAGDVLTHKTPKEYKMAVTFGLAHNYGFSRIMSSYFFDSTDQGPPSTGGGGTNDVQINGDGSCGGGWVCEHRWTPITNMVKFRNAVAGTVMENWYQEGDNVAFSRGNKGFFAMSKWGDFDMTLQTGLPAGSYEEMINGGTVTVNGDGTAQISIHNGDDPMFAICAGCSFNL